MSDSEIERPPRFYGSDAENVRGVDNIEEVEAGITSTEVVFTVSYPNASGYDIAFPKSYDLEEWGDW